MTTPAQAIADYDAVRVTRLPDDVLLKAVGAGPPTLTSGDWWRACVHELARRHPVVLTASEMVADHRGVRA